MVVDALVFLGFMVNRWVSVSHRFWVLWMLLFSGEFLWVSVGFSAYTYVCVCVCVCVFLVAGMDMGLLG